MIKHATMVAFQLFLFLHFTYTLQAQEHVKTRIDPSGGSREKQLDKIKDTKVKLFSDSSAEESAKSDLIDSTKLNKYGDLLEDDIRFNKRYPVWIPAFEVLAANAMVWSMDRYIMDADFSKIGPSTWKFNVETGWEWDQDRFGINFIGHPYSGTMSFNAGRSNGYNYWQSFLFAVGGSLMWEYFGENTQPSYNDIINTPVNGAFLGEIFYRLSSNILDDRTSGMNRFGRELSAGLIDPIRGLNRLIQGKSFRKTNIEVYQKEPLNIILYAGMHYYSDGEAPSQMVNAQFDYGNPFENQNRKPFDFFKLRVDLNFSVGRKVLDNISGYGILVGKNSQKGKSSILMGAFQHFDYWDNKTFELGTIGFGGGIFHKLAISKTSALYSNIHGAVVPFAGNSRQVGPDSSQVRDYDFGGGFEGKFESTLNISNYATLTMIYYYYMLHTYVGAPGNNFVSILKPRVTIHVFKSASIGYEYFVYTEDRYLQRSAYLHAGQAEQKLFVQIFFEDRQRKGRYN